MLEIRNTTTSPAFALDLKVVLRHPALSLARCGRIAEMSSEILGR
jgi:hypothetical protein